MSLALSHSPFLPHPRPLLRRYSLPLPFPLPRPPPAAIFLFALRDGAWEGGREEGHVACYVPDDWFSCLGVLALFVASLNSFCSLLFFGFLIFVTSFPSTLLLFLLLCLFFCYSFFSFYFPLLLFFQVCFFLFCYSFFVFLLPVARSTLITRFGLCCNSTVKRPLGAPCNKYSRQIQLLQE